MNKAITKILIGSSMLALMAACVPENNIPKPDNDYSWYEDSDGDGFGNPDTKFTGDNPGSGWVSNGKDCDDSDAGINPDADDIENGVDDNCDGKADDTVNYMFITSGLVSADMSTYATPEGTGLEGADRICQNYAERSDSNAPVGTYKAWLSDSVTAAKDRLHHSNHPYKLLDGTDIADNWQALTTQPLKNVININEKGLSSTLNFSDIVPDTSAIWSGTTQAGEQKYSNANQISGGNRRASFCDNWTSKDAMFNYQTPEYEDTIFNGGLTEAQNRLGDPEDHTTSEWSYANGAQWCNKKARLLCIRQ